jgi:hypothetical protein
MASEAAIAPLLLKIVQSPIGAVRGLYGCTQPSTSAGFRPIRYAR